MRLPVREALAFIAAHSKQREAVSLGILNERALIDAADRDDLLDACAMCQTGFPEHQNHRPLHWRWTMAAAQFSLPKQWEDWCSWLLGLWLCISPWALRFDLEPTATRITVITGILIILAEMMTLSVYQAWEEWINVILGAWLVICPWILGISSSVARVNLIGVGLLVMALAFYEIWEARRQPSNQT